MSPLSTPYLEHPDVKKYLDLIKEIETGILERSFDDCENLVQKIEAQRKKIPVFFGIRLKSDPQTAKYQAVEEACYIDAQNSKENLDENFSKSPVSVISIDTLKSRLSSNAPIFRMPIRRKQSNNSSARLLKYIYELAITVLQRHCKLYQDVIISRNFDHLETGALVNKCFLTLKDKEISYRDRKAFFQSPIGQLFIQQVEKYNKSKSK
jgi:hypothetical protein